MAELTLGQKQELFMRLLPRLIDRMHEAGYQVRGGELERSKAQAADNAASGAGIANSLHIVRLAIDLHLFKDGKYLASGAEHMQFGAYWKTLDPSCRHGGDFSRPDPNHYSLEFEGRK